MATTNPSGDVQEAAPHADPRTRHPVPASGCRAQRWTSSHVLRPAGGDAEARWWHAARGLPGQHLDGCRQAPARRYWKWFSDHWNADKAVRVIEDVIDDGGRPRWID